VTLLSLLACTSTAPAPLANHGTRARNTDIRTIDWENRTYQLDELGPVTVHAGRAEFQISEDNRAVERGLASGSYTIAAPLFADVDHDGVDDAIIWSILASGGTGHFSDIQVYTLRAGTLAVLAEIPGGDRGDGGIRDVALDGTAVIVDRNVLAPGDGLCCPSAAQRERWTWQHGALVENVAARAAIAIEGP